MAPERHDGRSRRKENAGRTVEKESGQGGGVTMVDVDAWGSFFEKFWEQSTEGGNVDRHEGHRKPAKGIGATYRRRDDAPEALPAPNRRGRPRKAKE